jgi:hypothetical protein
MACQGHTIPLLARQEDLQEQTESIVAQRPQCNLSIIETNNALFGPAHFTLELVEGQGRGAQERRCGTPRHIIANEGEGIDKQRKTEDDCEGSWSVAQVSTRYQEFKLRKSIANVRPTKFITALLGDRLDWNLRLLSLFGGHSDKRNRE